MTTQPTILAAVDLDRQAAAVITRAARLASLCRARLVVAHVVEEVSGYQPDQPFTQRPAGLRAATQRHARAWLVGMLNHLDLPNDRLAIRVEAGPLSQTLADLVEELQPRYCLLGSARLGPFSPSAGLPEAIGGRSDCELLAIKGQHGGGDEGLGHWVRHWLDQWLHGEARVRGGHA